MNVKRFIGRTSREAMNKVRGAFGDGAVVLSTQPCAEGVEILAMAPETAASLDRFDERAASAKAPAKVDPDVERDVGELAMSTLSFQDYVRERMLKKREAAIKAQAHKERAELPPVPTTPQAIEQRLAQRERIAREGVVGGLLDQTEADAAPAATAHAQRRSAGEAAAARAEQAAMMNELRSMKGLIEERFGALAFMEKLQRDPKRAMVTSKLLDCGFSPALTRKLVAAVPANTEDALAWATEVLARNVHADDEAPPIEDVGGVYALVGATGVGKTTTTAKVAAAFAAKHGANQLGLITLDAYRLGAHEQLRAYGRILGVPVHVAHDRAALEDLLELLAAKKLVLIDTAGLAQRDERTRELLQMLSHRSIKRVLVINAASQGETIEDVMVSYRAASSHGVVLTKLDEAVKLAPALDAAIRHHLAILGVANGQRVPEDWHRLSARALVRRAVQASAHPAFRMDDAEVSLVFAAPSAAGPASMPDAVRF
jgi:flagellar biosynthesis protein FlhF